MVDKDEDAGQGGGPADGRRAGAADYRRDV
jgi:hypothetical protein